MPKEDSYTEIENIYGPIKGDLENIIKHMFNFFDSIQLDEFVEFVKEEEGIS